MKRSPTGVIVLFLILITLSCPASANDAKEVVENFRDTLLDYLASTPSKAGEIPGSTELISVARNSPDIVCGISIVMISDARLRLVLEFNKASDEGNYDEIERISNRISEIAKLSSDVEISCQDYFDSKDNLYSDSDSPEQAPEYEIEEDGPCAAKNINKGDTETAKKIYLEATSGLREAVNAFHKLKGRYSDFIADYLTKKSGFESGTMEQEIKCEQIEGMINEANNYLDFLVNRRQKLEPAIFAANNMKIDCTWRDYIWIGLSTIDKEMERTTSTIATLMLIRKEKCGTKYSCANFDEAIEKQNEALALKEPNYLAKNMANKKVNIQCGMSRIINMVISIDSKTGTATSKVEMDESGSNVYGVRFDENGKLTEQVIKGGWENPSFVVRLHDKDIEDIMGSDDPIEKTLGMWGKTITFKGTNPTTQAQTGALNLANAINRKFPENNKINNNWKIPPLNWMNPAAKQNLFKFPTPKTFGSIALNPAKMVFKKLLPEPRPASQCMIRNIPYNCYRNSLTLSTQTTERGKKVTIKADPSSGFKFRGSVDLIVEPVGGSTLGYTVLKINGNVKDEKTFEFNAHIPSGQYMVAAIVDNRPIDDFADSAQTLTISGMAPTDVPGNLGESCDNRKCASNAICAAKYTYGGGRRITPSYGYTCMDKKDYTALCMPKGTSPAPYHCIT